MQMPAEPFLQLEVPKSEFCFSDVSQPQLNEQSSFGLKKVKIAILKHALFQRVTNRRMCSDSMFYTVREFIVHCRSADGRCNFECRAGRRDLSSFK